MELFDVNILVYAHREDQEHHHFFRQYVESHLNSGQELALSQLVAADFVRTVTHSSFPNGPTPLAQALSTIDSLTSLDRCHWVRPSQRHWAITANLCRESQSTGKQVADAQHAAIAIEHACRWVTRDQDFRVFRPFGLNLKLLEP
jgi:toxin-antitoxin system PIN domain toxin